MKKLLAILLALGMLLSVIPFAAAEEADEAPETSEPTVLEIAMNRPVSEEPTHITVGNTTKVKGSFFTTYFGNNTSDIDVRTMIHGYSPVVWDNQIQFIEDPMVVQSITRVNGPEGPIFTIRLQQDLVYNDGITPITARDYVFSWLFTCSPELMEIGAETPKVEIVGFDAFHDGETPILRGVRLLDDYTFSIAVDSEYEVYFYDYARLLINPYPIDVIAPGCTVRDDGDGAYLEGPFTAELLERTILDPETGYASHPSLTSGPYTLLSYDREEGVVEFAINPYYKGNFEGVKPVIDTITLVPVLPKDMVQKLESREVDVLNKCVDQSVILAAMQLNGQGFAMENYARIGYGFCAFSCEQGPQQFVAVRQALNYAFDSEAFIRSVLGGFGLPVYGYYGLGQWMYMAAAGTLRPEDLPEAEQKAWDALTLDVLNPYPLDLDEANRLLDEDGWTLNENGETYSAEKDSLRCKLVDGELMPLSLHFARCKDNPSADTLVSMYEDTLPQIGARFEVEDVEFNELLADYYRDEGQRRFDMNFMATNFVSTFDPYLVFLGREDMQGAVNTSGIVDEELIRLAFEMRSTEPGDLLTFEQRWLKMQERYNEILPTMPIYGNVYFDFHTDWLQNYRPNAEYSWPVAILYAFYGEPIVEEEEEDLEEEDEFDVFAENGGYELPEFSAVGEALNVQEVLAVQETLAAPEVPEAQQAPAAESPAPATAESSPAGDQLPIAESSLPAASDVTVSVTATMPPKDGVAYRPGEVINFLMIAVNHSSENLRNLSITDSVTGKSAHYFDFLHGEKVPFMAGYTVTEEDAARGVIRSEVTASAVSRSGETFSAVPFIAEFPVGK